jgi:hypothetical protein
MGEVRDSARHSAADQRSWKIDANKKKDGGTCCRPCPGHCPAVRTMRRSFHSHQSCRHLDQLITIANIIYRSKRLTTDEQLLQLAGSRVIRASMAHVLAS